MVGNNWRCKGIILHSLKDEYGDELRWVIPYPGDFHVLMNFQTEMLL